MPGGGGMGTFGIVWANKCNHAAPNSPASLFIQAFFRQLHKLRLLFFFYQGVGQGGKRYSLKSKAAVF